MLSSVASARRLLVRVPGLLGLGKLVGANVPEQFQTPGLPTPAPGELAPAPPPCSRAWPTSPLRTNSCLVRDQGRSDNRRATSSREGQVYLRASPACYLVVTGFTATATASL